MKRKNQRRLSISAILAISVLLDVSVSAQDLMGWSQCLGREGPIIDVVIEGCTAIIQAGQDTPVKLALAFNNRGVAYRLKGEYDLALQDYDHAIGFDPNSASHYNNRGIIYRIKHEYARAIADYDEAIWLRADYPAAFYNRALAYADEGDYDHALADFNVVMQFDTRNSLALYARGMTLLKKGDVEAGKANIAAAKTINPNIGEQFDQSDSAAR